jgi:NAD(P)-dependent dehydrogenase (short-subunit alcohol dehydrogenase family)
MRPESAQGVRRDKAALSSGCKCRAANAPAASSRVRRGFWCRFHPNAEGGREARGVICDVANYEPCEAMISASAKAFGRVDILVNNAALFALKGA